MTAQHGDAGHDVVTAQHGDAGQDVVTAQHAADAGEATAGPPPPPPRWFYCLPLLAMVAWWPLDPAWQSDDFLAVHYASSLRRCLADFVGPQYAASDLWLFYRPLITLSFWFDQQIGGSNPCFAHWMNTLAHAATALVAGLLWRRFAGNGQAFLLALWWSCLPGHAGAVAWAVGRVDGYTTLCCLLSLWCLLRRHERQQFSLRSAAPALCWLLLAFLCKELAVVVPAAASLLLFARLPRQPLWQRAKLALQSSAALWLLLGCYLLFRYLLLGRLGGYLAASYEPMAMLQGLLTSTGKLLTPGRWPGAAELLAKLGVPTAVWPWLCWLVVLLALSNHYRRPRRLLFALLLFVVTTAPMAAFLADSGNLHSQRYFYLPSIALLGVLAAARCWQLWLCLLVLLPGLLASRQSQHTADRESGRLHAALLASHGKAPGPWFVAGLPHNNQDGTVIQLHFGVDRMLQPPFASGEVAVYAHRPLAELPQVLRLLANGSPLPLPQGSTLLPAGDRFVVAPQLAKALPDLPLAGDDDGELDCSTARLWELTAAAPQLFGDRKPSFGLRTPGVKPAAYRVTIFTANGYLCCLCAEHGLMGATDGWLDMLRFLANDPVLGIPPAVVALAGTAWAGEALQVPVTMDLDPSFPVLVEAGDLDLARGGFVATHRARRLLRFRFDRGYAAWVRAIQGKA